MRRRALHALARAEPAVERRHRARVDVIGHADRDVGRLLVLRVGVDLRVALRAGLHVDLMHGLDPGRLEVQAGLLDADDRAVAEQHGPVALVDGVEGSEQGAERQQAGGADAEDGGNPGDVHG